MTFYADYVHHNIETQYLDSLTWFVITFEDVVLVKIKDQQLDENRLIYTYLLQRDIGLLGFQTRSGDKWRLY